MNTEQLEKEVELGERAAKAYSLWVMHYIDTQSVVIFEEFKNSKEVDYQTIKSNMIAIMAIETAIKQDIDTGKLASRQLQKGY